MWFFRSIELLPRPTFIGLAPTVAMLAVWGLFEGSHPVLFGRPVQPLWLALVSAFALAAAGRLPPLFARTADGPISRLALVGAAGALGIALAAAVFVADPRLLQLAWILGWLGYAGLFVLLLATSRPDELALLPFRWASDHPFTREAMWIVAVRLAAVALAAVLVAVHGTLTEWVVTISLGRLGLFYLFEWITILFAITWRGGDG